MFPVSWADDNIDSLNDVSVQYDNTSPTYDAILGQEDSEKLTPDPDWFLELLEEKLESNDQATKWTSSSEQLKKKN